MNRRYIVGSISLGVIILLLAVTVPTMVDTTHDNQTTTLLLNQDDTVTVTDDLELTVDRINETSADSNITLTNVPSQNNSELLLNVSETKNTTIDGEFLNATLRSIRDNSTGVFVIEYSSTYGWHPGAKVFIANIDVVLVGLVVFVPVAFIVVLFTGKRKPRRGRGGW